MSWNLSEAENELFRPKVEVNRLNPDFVGLANSEFHNPARKMAAELFSWRSDPDGNFVKDLQTTGFDARVFELYLTGAFRSDGFEIRRDLSRPDFVAYHEEFGSVALEATTCNPSGDDNQDVGTLGKDLLGMDRVAARKLLVKKLVNSVERKLAKNYFKDLEIDGMPFVIAVQSFTHIDSLSYTASAFVHEVFGFQVDEIKRTVTNLGCDLFSKWSPNLSGIVFSNKGTVGKLQRMGIQAGYEENGQTLCVEQVIDPDPQAFVPKLRQYKVASGKSHDSWVRGLTVLHNPYATRPLHPYFFIDAEHIQKRDGEILASTPNDHPFTVFQVTAGKESHLKSLSEVELDKLKRAFGVNE